VARRGARQLPCRGGDKIRRVSRQSPHIHLLLPLHRSPSGGVWQTAEMTWSSASVRIGQPRQPPTSLIDSRAMKRRPPAPPPPPPASRSAGTPRYGFRGSCRRCWRCAGDCASVVELEQIHTGRRGVRSGGTVRRRRRRRRRRRSGTTSSMITAWSTSWRACYRTCGAYLSSTRPCFTGDVPSNACFDPKVLDGGTRRGRQQSEERDRQLVRALELAPR
jgi:hypothetical protein